MKLKKLFAIVLCVAILGGILSYHFISPYDLCLKPKNEQILIEWLYKQLDEKRSELSDVLAEKGKLQDEAIYTDLQHENQLRIFKNQIWLLKKENYWQAKAFEDKVKDLADDFEAELKVLDDKNKLLKREKERLNKELSKKLFDWFAGKHPASQDELIGFLTADDTNKTIYDKEKHDWVCVEYTTLLMANAAEAGYRIYPTIVWFIDARTMTVIDGHTMNFAIVEYPMEDGSVAQIVYLIEPQNDQWWQFGIWRDKSTWQLPKKLYPFMP